MEFVPVQMVDMKIAAKLDISDLDIPQKEKYRTIAFVPSILPMINLIS